jgi:cyclomaltodextrinase / maltogenic alpha-amylase / neopullulanase
MKSGLSIFFLSITFITGFLAQPKTPVWASSATIYEVNIRQYTPEGTFEAFQKHLPRLKELGVDILWLMPINPIGEKNRKGTLGSYYSVKDYKEINPEFGTKADFKILVDEIHKLGMYVIVDWVANHTAWDHQWVSDHPEYYTKDSLGNFVPPVADWADVVDLNYDNLNLRREMIDALSYWVKEFNIDGYRCDVAGMVPTEFWNTAREELDKIKPVFMLAEWETSDLHETAFEMTYAWETHKMMNNIYKGEKSAGDLRNLMLEDQKKFQDYAYRMQFTSNHDENTWNGTEFERLGDAVEMFAVLTYIIPGMPLIYNGQEAGFNRRLDFFEKDLITWKESEFSELYSRLNKLKKTNKALLNGKHGAEIEFMNFEDNDNILALIRDNGKSKVIGLFNMSSEEVKLDFNSSKISGLYNDFENNLIFEIKDKLSIVLKPWSYKLLNKD